MQFTSQSSSLIILPLYYACIHGTTETSWNSLHFRLPNVKLYSLTSKRSYSSNIKLKKSCLFEYTGLFFCRVPYPDIGIFTGGLKRMLTPP